MLAIMSGKPHAICLGASEMAGQKKKDSGMFAWEYSAKGGKPAVKERNKFNYSETHTPCSANC